MGKARERAIGREIDRLVSTLRKVVNTLEFRGDYCPACNENRAFPCPESCELEVARRVLEGYKVKP